MTAATQFINTQDLYEVLLTFFDNVEQQPLNTLARLCKATSPLALDALWHTLTVPTNIIRLLPEDACRLTVPGFGQARQFMLERPLIESDFAIFDKYASRVRVVQCGGHRGFSMGSEIFSALKGHRDPIFPHLRELVWHPSTNPNSLHASCDFLGVFHLVSRHVPLNKLSLTLWEVLDIPPETLARLPIHISADMSNVVARMNKPLASWIPDVPTLELCTGSNIALPDILGGLTALTQLRHLRVNFSVGPTILSHLAGLPQLVSLHLWEESANTIQMLSALVDHLRLTTGLQSFPALESISLNTVRSCSSVAIDTLLPLITSDALRSSSFSVDDTHPIDFAFVSLLAAPHRATQLRDIQIYVTKLHPSQAEVSSDVLAPLYSCVNLESFDFLGALYIEEPHFARMTVSWPRLLSLRLVNTQPSPPAPAVHIYALWGMLQTCPQLRKLIMPVDARVTGAFERPAPEGLQPMYAMGDIMFLASPCERADAHPVAAFLNRAFPRLAQFGGTVESRGPSEADVTWDIVKNQLPEVDTEYRMMMASLLAEELGSVSVQLDDLDGVGDPVVSDLAELDCSDI
ncbi:hypothetical protein DFH06DRAFT_139501 [Mycena polygramma]|nr:hypothetical protein DFH06DRAFT_139501 [Mycena polygramma]